MQVFGANVAPDCGLRLIQLPDGAEPGLLSAARAG
ncbi:hypothetical protein EAO28_10400 [Klebsiella pneumoniae]|uniref:Uncharacterized protein n=1 Tax=Klebsiella pneumoniae TaxID=573 RepID=A0A3P2EGB8_KLEPN|nr:hypothetical protein EAO28_10400 [Klebsiella pneumoniae]